MKTHKYCITNPPNEKAALEKVAARLASEIFNQLIQKEKDGIRLTVIMEICTPEEFAKADALQGGLTELQLFTISFFHFPFYETTI